MPYDFLICALQLWCSKISSALSPLCTIFSIRQHAAGPRLPWDGKVAAEQPDRLLNGTHRYGTPKAVRGAHYKRLVREANHILPDSPDTPETPETPDTPEAKAFCFQSRPVISQIIPHRHSPCLCRIPIKTRRSIRTATFPTDPILPIPPTTPKQKLFHI